MPKNIIKISIAILSVLAIATVGILAVRIHHDNYKEIETL